MSLQGWRELKCPDCGGKSFVPTVYMLWQNGMGQTTRPNGHFCLACKKLVDQAKMVLYAKKQDAEEKIRDLESSING
jgi:hypothetical protein